MASRSLGQLTIDLIAKTAGFDAGMDKAARLAAKRSKEIQGAITGSFKTIGVSIAGFVAGLTLVDTAIRGVTQAIDAADNIAELSTRFNISTETLSEWGYALNQSGSSLEEFSSVIPKFSKNIAAAADETSELGKIFKALNIDAVDPLTGKLATVESLLPKVADAFKGITDDTLKTNLAMQLFGKSGAGLIEFLENGSDGLDTFAEKARSLGIIIGQDTASAADEFNDRLGDLKAATQGLFTQIAAQLLPELIKTTQQLTALVTQGDLAANIVTVISAAMRAGVGVINTYNQAVAATTIGIEQLVQTARGVAEAQANISTLGAADGSVLDGIRRIATARGQANKEWEQYLKIQDEAQRKAASPFSGVTGKTLGDSDYKAIKDRAKATDDAASAQKRLQNLLLDDSGAKKSAEAAAALQKQYESLTASMKQQIALYGQTTEEAKLRYDLENTELSKLTQAQKDNLIVLAQQADAQERIGELQKAADESVRRQAEDYERGVKATDDLIAQMEFEANLLGKTNRERAIATELRNADINATDAQIAKIEELAGAYQDAQERISVMDDLRDSFKGFFEDVITGNKSILDSFKDLLSNISEMIASRIAQNWVDQLFGQQGSSAGGSAGGSWFATIASMFAGGRANGGMVQPGNFVEVNERGIEMATVGGRSYLLAGNSPVEVTPNHQVGGSGITVNQSFLTPGMIDKKTATQQQQLAAQNLRLASARNG